MRDRFLNLRPLAVLPVILLASAFPRAGVVINEIFYHAPDDIEDLEWIELVNASDEGVPLTGWRIAGGLRYEFKENVRLDPGEFLIVAKDRSLVHDYYEEDVVVVGEFRGSLGDGDDVISLQNAHGVIEDEVHYEDRHPWPLSADGLSGSIERICPLARQTGPHHWAPSRPSMFRDQPGGSPGQVNSVYATRPPPRIWDLELSSQLPNPGERVAVRARVSSKSGVAADSVKLRLIRVLNGANSETVSIPMSPDDTGENRFEAEVSAGEPGELMRFQVEARSVDGGSSVFPHPHDVRPALSAWVGVRPLHSGGRLPDAYLMSTTPEAHEAELAKAGTFYRGRFGEMNRPKTQALAMVRRASNLADPWFALTVERGVSGERYSALRAIVQQALASRKRLESEIEGLSDNEVETVTKTLPERLDGMVVDFQNAVLPMLPESDREDVASWLKAHFEAGKEAPNFGDPDAALKQFVNLEYTWLYLTIQAGLPTSPDPELINLFRDAQTRRADLKPVLEQAMQQQTMEAFQGFQDLAGEVNSAVNASLEAILGFRQQREYARWQEFSGGSPFAGSAPRLPSVGHFALAVVDPDTDRPELFDFVNVSDRSAGYKIRFLKDQRLRGMSTINVIFEENDRFVLAEHLAYELYRLAGTAAPRSGFLRLSVDGRPLGYQLWFEQPNRSFVRRHGWNDRGHLYKLVWYGTGIVGQHEKKTRGDDGHDGLIALIRSLEATEGDKQWRVIEQFFDVANAVNYFVVNACLSHWDGFFNNYFTFHDSEGDGKWRLVPWDQDKTWGFYSGLPEDEVFFDMPIAFGMAGDRPPEGAEGGFAGSWWRPPGHFSGPLLANPQFRRKYLDRTREILDSIYTEERFFPIIDELAETLKDEPPLRARAYGKSETDALRRFERNIDSLKTHLQKRRAFLLSEAELKDR